MSQNNDNIISIPLITDTRPIDLVKHQKDRLPPETVRPDPVPQQEGTVSSQQEITIPLDPRLNLTRETPAFDIPLPLPVFPDNQDIRSIVLDTLKNISINGISPQISGSSIAFNIPESPYSASQLWGLMNTANVLGDVSSSTQAYGGYISQSSFAEQPNNIKQTTQDNPPADGGAVITASTTSAAPSSAPSAAEYVAPNPDSAAVSPTQPPPVTSTSTDSVASATTAAIPPSTTDTTTNPPVGPLTDALNNTYSGSPTAAPVEATTSPQVTTSSDNGGGVVSGAGVSLSGGLQISDESSSGSDSTPTQYDQPATETGSGSVQHGFSGEPIPALHTADQANSESNQLLAVPFKRGDKGAPQMVYFVTAGYEPIESDPKPNQNINSAYGGPIFTPSDYWIPVGGSGGGTFIASLRTNEDGVVIGVDVSSGSYHILNTNTDVPESSGNGNYVYAIIEHSNAGIFESFKIEISGGTKQPTEMDSTGKFVKKSNVLLAEQMTDSEGNPIIIQRRTGNLSLVHQVVSGHICLWAYSSGGTSL